MIEDDVRTQYKAKKLILFVGAGVSQNLGLPSWRDLINQVAKELNYDPAIFQSYGEYLALAEYYRTQKGSLGPLRSWMDTNWHSNTVDIHKSKIHKYIVEGKFPIIYTTNYDRWLEKAFDANKEKFTKIATVPDFSKIEEGVTQIIKFHGDFDYDETLVLDESSYYERLEFESPLDIKLRSDVLGQSILFIGYSLSDVNIRYLFYKLSKLWKSTSGRYGGTQPRSYLFTNKPNPIQEEVLKQWGIDMIVSDEIDAGIALEKFLKKLIKC